MKYDYDNAAKTALLSCLPMLKKIKTKKKSPYFHFQYLRHLYLLKKYLSINNYLMDCHELYPNMLSGKFKEDSQNRYYYNAMNSINGVLSHTSTNEEKRDFLEYCKNIIEQDINSNPGIINLKREPKDESNVDYRFALLCELSEQIKMIPNK